MDLQLKTPPTLSNSEMDAQSLRNRHIELKEEHNNFLLAGDFDSVMRTKKLLAGLPDLITAKDVQEFKKKLDSADSRLSEIKQETLEVEAIRGEKNKILADKLKAVEQAGLAVENVNRVLYLLDAESQTLLEARREYKNKLSMIIENMGEKENGF